MDFLSRNVITGALACALGLVSLPAFAVLDSPNYSWRQTRDGQAYKVYDPQGPHLSNNFTPNSSFAENSAGNGVIETVTPGPLTIDGATGEILNGVGLSRGLTVGDLIDGAQALMVPDNPYGAAFLALTLVGSLAVDAYENANPPSPSYGCYAGGYYYVGFYPPQSYQGPYPSLSAAQSVCPSGTAGCGIGDAVYSSGPFANQCSSSGVYTPPTETPSQAIQWAQVNPSSFASNVAPTLNGSPADQTALANDLSNSNAPLSPGVPYGYTIPSSDSSVTGPSTTSSSTDPSTGNTTTTTTTPTFDFSTPNPPSEILPTEKVVQVTQTCTGSGSCTTQQITTNSPATQPKLGSFTAPTLSAPGSSVLTPTPYPLNFALPSQSNATCPQPISYTAFGTTFNIPLTPLCSLATNVRPYVESLGAVGAGIVIFR
ncbi:MAG: virulence factor TspB C-terminal domain-related protein [Acidithiobacillus sp.]